MIKYYKQIFINLQKVLDIIKIILCLDNRANQRIVIKLQKNLIIYCLNRVLQFLKNPIASMINFKVFRITL